MSWALVQSNSAGSGSASPAVAFTTANLSAGTTEICYATSYAGTTTGVSDGTNAFIKIAAVSNGGGEVSCWALNTPSGKVGTKPTITATQSGNTGSSGILIQEVSGLAVGATLALLADGTPGTGTYTSGTTAGPPSYTDGVAGEYLVYVLGDQGFGTTYTLPTGSGYTEDTKSQNGSGNGDIIVCYKSSTGGTETGSYGFSGGVGCGLILVAFKLPAAAAAVSAHVTPQVPPGLQSPAAWAPLMPSPWPPQPPPLLPASAALSGSGSMTAAGGALSPGAAAMDGEGYLTAAGGAGYGAMLDGEGYLTALSPPVANLYGAGSLTALPPPIANLSGAGTMGLNVTLKLTVGLSGTGSMSIPQVAGGLVNGVGGAGIPYALPGSSQVAVAPPGSAAWQWLGTLGQVTALTYSFVCPGGCDKMTCTVMVPAAYRTQLFNPGWQVKITRGGHDVWHGKLDEPQPSPSGWTLTAVGQGNRGQDFLAIYTSTWPASQPDQSVNNAISRGMPWVNPGVGTPSGAWYGQAVDSGAQTVTALLNLICTRGGLTWYVNSQPGGQPGDDLSVFPLPTVPNRLLVATTPVARTLGGDINTIWIRYESAADNATTGAAATYATTSVQNAQSVAAHGVIETYIDLSDVGVQSAGAAQAVGNAALQVYVRASFAGPFTVSYGQLLNTGGQPIDPGTDQAATMVRMILADWGLGGEVTPQFPIEWIVGAYEWDDFQQVATLTPYVALDQSLTGVLSMMNTTLTPITVASS